MRQSIAALEKSKRKTIGCGILLRADRLATLLTASRQSIDPKKDSGYAFPEDHECGGADDGPAEALPPRWQQAAQGGRGGDRAERSFRIRATDRGRAFLLRYRQAAD
jgi:hypothetical protein